MEQSGLDVAVAAPTGRAAKRITQTSGKGAMTVHRLLEYYYDEEARHMAFGRNQDNPLDYGAVIIDEASMMDLMLSLIHILTRRPGAALMTDISGPK